MSDRQEGIPMHLSRLFSAMLIVATAGGATIVACGGSSNPKTPDAKVFKDAPPQMDAPAGLTGLGEKCGSGGVSMCPSNASDCVGITGLGSTSFCTPNCLMNGSGTTNSSGKLLLSAITPAPSNTTCQGAFSGSAGTPACVLIGSYSPMDVPMKANTQYTAISMDCALLCGTGSGTGPCPSGMTCMSGACIPN
ncbi:MAG: hypothetical protein ACM31C_26000 [Acidobacteriota bacterium]